MKKRNKRIPSLFVGIDPAFRENGIGYAELDMDSNNVTLRNIGLLEFITLVNENHFSESVVCVENSNLQNASFDLKGSRLEIARKSRNAGSNQAVSQIMCDLLKDNCIKLIEVSPKEKGMKWDQSTFTSVYNQLGYTIYSYSKNGNPKKTTSQDQRDAFKLMLITKQRY